jgi:hypothetical protein
MLEHINRGKIKKSHMVYILEPFRIFCKFDLVAGTGLEPVTSWL